MASGLPDFVQALLAKEGVMVMGGGEGNERGRDGDNTLSDDAQILILREAQQRYSSENFFEVGDLVTPREGFNMRGAGNVHIVIEKRPKEEAEYAFNVHETAGSSGIGRRLDMRVLTMMGDEVTPFWVESHTYEFHPLHKRDKE